MTTGIALPFSLGFKMSGLRQGTPDRPLPQTSQVRKNLFGPIDHEENLKFVQDELTKISQADCKRWNFDFQAERPTEGRYSWEPVSEKVPQAYEMRAMSCSRGISTPTATTAGNVTTQEDSAAAPAVPTTATHHRTQHTHIITTPQPRLPTPHLSKTTTETTVPEPTPPSTSQDAVVIHTTTKTQDLPPLTAANTERLPNATTTITTTTTTTTTSITATTTTTTTTATTVLKRQCGDAGGDRGGGGGGGDLKEKKQESSSSSAHSKRPVLTFSQAPINCKLIALFV